MAQKYYEERRIFGFGEDAKRNANDFAADLSVAYYVSRNREEGWFVEYESEAENDARLLQVD